ncbi:MAG: hypothetical protein ABIY70_21700 [Capsulimonas sp.]|uniref:hypothetical protein n=1 Tax=Capsulimonas sp. TaxID=2494211 RepID=UPI0032675374
MSVGYSGGTYVPPRSVNYGWIGESWNLLTQEVSPWIISQIIYIVAGFAISFVISMILVMVGGGGMSGMWRGQYSSPSQESSIMTNAVSSVFSLAINVFQASAYYRMAVKQVRGEPITLNDAFNGATGYWQMLAAFILFGLLSFAGLLACVVGVFFVTGLLMPALALVADGESAPRAISRSWDAMKVDWVNAGLFSILFAALYLVSMIPCFLGLLITIPMMYLIAALAYRDMIGMPARFAPMDYGVAQAGVWPPPPSIAPPNPQTGAWPPPTGQTGAWPPPTGQTGAWPPPQSGQSGAWPPPQGGNPSGTWPPPQDPQSFPDDPNRPQGNV